MDFKTRYQYNPKTDLLGRGGFATVYKAHDTLLNRTVALKFYANTGDKHTLIQEISRAISLEHPNLCRYYDATLQEITNFHGETEKMEIGVMEYLDCGDLKSYCKIHPEQQIKLLIDVLKGLSFLHKCGIIHRDLKPANILIKNAEDGPLAKITDFGISKDAETSNTSSSQLMGTIEYMAPEQLSPLKYGLNGKIGTNLDLWSFGVLVYELVAGESMFGGRGGQTSAEQVISNILNDDLIEKGIKYLPEPYFTVLSKCLIKDANQRAQKADELIGFFQREQDFITFSSITETRSISLVNNNVETVKIPTVLGKKQEDASLKSTNYLNIATIDIFIAVATLVMCCIGCYLVLTPGNQLSDTFDILIIIGASVGISYLAAKKQIVWFIKKCKCAEPAEFLRRYSIDYLATASIFYGIPGLVLVLWQMNNLLYLNLFIYFLFFIACIVYLIVIMSSKRISATTYLSRFTRIAFIFFNLALTLFLALFFSFSWN